jgi:hypothetical protein
MEDAHLNSHSSPLDAIEERAEEDLNQLYWEGAGIHFQANDSCTAGAPDYFQD